MYRIILSICLACGLLFLNSGQVQAISIDVLPDHQEANINSPVSVNITISGLGDGVAPSLSSFDLNIIYDPTILSFPGMSGVTFGDQLDLSGSGSDRTIDNSTLGIINLFEFSYDFPDELDNMQQDSFILATLTFDTILKGTSVISVTVNDLIDANGEYLIADLNGAQIKVVPIPGAIWLFYSGLACLVAIRRRRGY